MTALSLAAPDENTIQILYEPAIRALKPAPSK